MCSDETMNKGLSSSFDSEPPAATNHESAAKVDRNDLTEIHCRYAAVLSIMNEKKCSLNNAYRLAGTARSTVRDFLGIAAFLVYRWRWTMPSIPRGFCQLKALLADALVGSDS